MELEYQDSEYFNETDTFRFENSLGQIFDSKVEFDKGYWWTTNCKHPQYKATTLKSTILPF